MTGLILMKDNANIMHYFVNKPVCADTFIFMRSLGYARDDRERSARDDREMVLVIGNKKTTI